MAKILLLIILVLFSTSAIGKEITDFNRFEMGTYCSPVSLQVIFSNNDTSINLNTEDIEIAVRSRLRSAGIYNEEIDSPILLVGILIIFVNPDPNVGFFQFDLLKGLEDPIMDDYGPATTWKTFSLSVNTDDSDILLQVSQLTDEFIDEYLRINAESC